MGQVSPEPTEAIHRKRKMLKKFQLTMVIAAGAFVVSVIAHNAISAWFGVEEPVFFTVAVFLCPTAFLVGLVGSIVSAIKKRTPR